MCYGNYEVFLDRCRNFIVLFFSPGTFRMYKTWMRLNVVVCLVFIYSHAEAAHKRLPMGFQGMRGKKSLDLSTPDDYPDYNPETLSRLQNYLMDQQFDQYYPSYKRTSMGFLGMRGKKEDTFSDPEEIFEYENEEKRGMKGFQGMRGKKQTEYPIFSYPNKRKSMGFQGMRGKKDVEELYNNNYGEGFNLLTNTPNFGYHYLSDLAMPINDFNKRAMRGFQGMRGKRGFDFNSAMQDKRAPTGFIGMRGKKDELDDKPEQNIDNALNEDQTKDEGMKEVVGSTILPTPNINQQLLALETFGNGDPLTSNLMDGHIVKKRSPSFGFFGIRGKKMPFFSSYFGTRGKKGPFDSPFRGKFVGVRGKKSDMSQQYDDRLLWADEYQKRRGPSGFIGVRGKKSVTPDDENNMFADAEGTEN